MGLGDILGKSKAQENTGGDGNGAGVVLPAKDSTPEKRGPGRPKGSSGAPRNPSVPDRDAGIDKGLIEELFKAELWGEVGALPFNIRKIMTGSDVFTLTDKQKAILGTSLAATLRQWGIVDPKYAALALLLTNFSTIMVEMEIRYRVGLPKKTDKKPDLKPVQGGVEGGGFSV